MSTDESEWMKQHGTYLNTLLEQGVVVAHGPVVDSAGSYGVSLFQIRDDQDIADLTADDPIIKNGVGHYEHFQMLQLSSRLSSSSK